MNSNVQSNLLYLLCLYLPPFSKYQVCVRINVDCKSIYTAPLYTVLFCRSSRGTVIGGLTVDGLFRHFDLLYYNESWLNYQFQFCQSKRWRKLFKKAATGDDRSKNVVVFGLSGDATKELRNKITALFNDVDENQISKQFGFERFLKGRADQLGSLFVTLKLFTRFY